MTAPAIRPDNDADVPQNAREQRLWWLGYNAGREDKPVYDASSASEKEAAAYLGGWQRALEILEPELPPGIVRRLRRTHLHVVPS